MSSAARTARYVRTWLSDRADLGIREIELDRDGTSVPATLYEPRGRRALPLWIVLHGITRPGRSHTQLVRFARALASTRAVVLVPEVPEWRELTLAPHLTVPTVRAALDALPALCETAHGPPRLVGFSFGAPQAIAASGAPGVEGRVDRVVGFGGYADLERTIRFQLTGVHDGGGASFRHRPDPYGRWIVAGNYLTSVPGLEDRTDVADAALHLARVAGDLNIPSWDPGLDALKDDLRAGVPEHDRGLYDMLVYGPDRPLDLVRADEMARVLTAAGRAHTPEIDAVARFGTVPGPVHILHGRNDHLVPFTEAERMDRALPEEVTRYRTVTRLFGHSARDPFPWVEGPREGVVFLRALSRMLADRGPTAGGGS